MTDNDSWQYKKLSCPCDAFIGQSRSTNMVPFHILGRVSLPRRDTSLYHWSWCSSPSSIGQLVDTYYAVNPPVHDRRPSLSRGSYSNIILKTRRFSDIRLRKCRDLEIRVRSRLRSLKVVPFDRLYMVSYYYPIVTLSVSRTVFEIFDFQYAVTLKIRLWVRRGHWKCHNSIKRIWLPIDVL